MGSLRHFALLGLLYFCPLGDSTTLRTSGAFKETSLSLERTETTHGCAT